jgi:predicted transcriptional regulator
MNEPQENNTVVSDDELVQLSGSIVAAYVSANNISVENVPNLIRTVHAALAGLSHQAPQAPAEEARRPAVPIRRSVTEEAVVCLECGISQKMLKRHLRARHGLSPSEYRSRWGLPYDYPLIAPAYSATRSRLAEETGLGRVAQGAKGRKGAKGRRGS